MFPNLNSKKRSREQCCSCKDIAKLGNDKEHPIVLPCEGCTSCPCPYPIEDLDKTTNSPNKKCPMNS